MVLVVFAEFLRGATLFLFEDAVEVAHIVEAAGIAYLRYGVGAVDKRPCGEAEAHVDDIVRHKLARSELEKTAESRRRHIGEVGELTERDFVPVIVYDITLNFAYAPRVGSCSHPGKGSGGEGGVFVARGKLMKHGEQLYEPVKVALHSHKALQPMKDVHDAMLREGEPQTRAVEHVADRRHLVLAQECLAENIAGELYCNLAYLFRLAVVLFPCVFYTAADKHKVIVADFLHRIAHYAAGARTAGNKIQLIFVMAVDRIIETVLIAVDDIKAVFVGQWSNLGNNFRIGFRHSIRAFGDLPVVKLRIFSKYPLSF